MNIEIIIGGCKTSQARRKKDNIKFYFHLILQKHFLPWNDTVNVTNLASILLTATVEFIKIRPWILSNNLRFMFLFIVLHLLLSRLFKFIIIIHVLISQTRKNYNWCSSMVGAAIDSRNWGVVQAGPWDRARRTPVRVRRTAALLPSPSRSG